MHSCKTQRKQAQVDKENYGAIPVREAEKSILNKLDKYIGETSSSLSEDSVAIGYEKLYWNLIDNLRKIVDDADGI
ncbi:MAG: hypothetical protein WA395_06830 [Nitrososphaeraceae archaeon]